MRRKLSDYNLLDEIAELGIKQAGVEFGKAFGVSLIFWILVLAPELFF